VRAVNKHLTEVGAFAVPAEFSAENIASEINGVAPVGQPEVGPLAEAPPVGADVQNLWYDVAVFASFQPRSPNRDDG